MTVRDLNRALLARQLLLARHPLSLAQAIARLGGLQAQQPRPPFVGLWSRLEPFERDALTRLLHERKVVRATAMRGTLHLLTAEDYLGHRAALQPGLTRGMEAILRERTAGLDLPAVLRVARAFLAAQPRTFTALRAHLLQEFPAGDERAMGYAVRTHLPLVVCPEERDWAFGADGEFALADTWLGCPPTPSVAPHALVRRYLAAFGPATAADFQTWSGLTGVAPVLAEMRPELAVFRDERRRELFDLPEAPRPSGEVPAPVRFIADFDNLILGHADRSRIITDEFRSRVVTKNLLVLPTFLVDGLVAGIWKITRQRALAKLLITPFSRLSSAHKSELSEEGRRLLAFVEPDAEKGRIEFA